MSDVEAISAYPSGLQVLELVKPLAKETKENIIASVAKLIKEASKQPIKGMNLILNPGY